MASSDTLKACLHTSSFCLREMIFFLDGGERLTLAKENIMAQLDEDPLFDDFLQKKRLLGKDDLRQLTFQRVKKLQEGLISDGTDESMKALRIFFYGLADFDMYIRYLVHNSLFGGAIYGQGTDQQRAKWLPLQKNMAIYGCFGMTEIGHGSFVRGLETTATFDQASDEFVVNSPTVNSTKWWIGGAAESATHCTVFAQLRVNGKDYGVHTFIVPLRDMDTFEVLPGILVGDCGMKMGGNGIDNGWIQFQNVRIPRENLLSRFASLSADGVYSPPPNPQLAYGALIGGRHTLIKYSVGCLKKALTIAVRYANIRKQGQLSSKQEEVCLMDYSNHQHRLLSHLALAYAWHFQMPLIESLTTQLKQGLESGDFSLLPEVHALTAGAKAFATWDTFKAINECREACGGHGYSEFNGLAPLQRDFAVMGTWEGDNSVMAQQTARFLISTFKRFQEGKPVFAESVAYLGEEFVSFKIKPSEEDLHTPEYFETVLAALCRYKVSEILREQEQAAGVGTSSADIWNQQQVELIACAKSHIRLCLLKSFSGALDAAPLNLKVVLADVFALAALTILKEESSMLMEAGIISPCSLRSIRQKEKRLCSKLASDSVTLVHAFNFSNRVLGSCIGDDSRSDIYHEYFKQANDFHAQNSIPPYNAEILDALKRGQQLIQNQRSRL